MTTKVCGHTASIFGSGKVTMSFLTSKEEAIICLKSIAEILYQAFDYLKINRPPDDDVLFIKQDADALQLCEFLPKSDCGKSGCFAFAIGLLSGTKEVDDCKLMQKRKHSNARTNPLKMLCPIDLSKYKAD